jgi:hypothetical protein
MHAYKAPDGTYQVTWKQAFRLSHFTRVVDPETGEPLQPDRMTLGLLGALGGVATSTTIAAGFLTWWIVLSESHGGVVAAITLLFLASIYAGLAAAVSQLVTFTKEADAQASHSS